MRELIFGEMTEEWKTAYEAGIFTEFSDYFCDLSEVLQDEIIARTEQLSF